MNRGLVKLACTALAGCGPEVVRLDLGAPSFDYGFALVTRGDRISRVTPWFVLEGGSVRFGSLPRVDLEDGEDGALLVELTRAELAAAVEGFEASAPELVRVEVAPPPSAPTSELVGERRFVTIGVPAGAELTPYGSFAADPAAVAGLRLVVPAAAEPCRIPGQDATAPFAARGQVLEDRFFDSMSDRARRIYDTLLLDDGRLVGLTPEFLFVLPRGGTIDLSDPSRRPAGALKADDFSAPPSFRRLVAMVLDRGALWVAATTEVAGEIWEVELASGGLRPVGTATITPRGPIPEPSDLTVDGDGTLIAVGDQGSVLFRRAGSAAFERAPRPPTNSDLRAVFATGDSARPHIAAGDDGRLHIGDLTRGATSVEDLGGGLQSLHIFDFAAYGDEIWAAAWRGLLFRHRPGEGWRPIELSVPPRFAACAGPLPGGGVGVTKHFRGVALHGPHLFLGVEECSALLQVRRSDLCTSVVTRESSAPANGEEEPYSVRVHAGELFVGGAHGRLHSLRLSPR